MQPGIQTYRLEPGGAWRRGATTSGDTLNLMVSPRGRLSLKVGPLFPLIIELRTGHMVWPERFRRMELSWEERRLHRLEVPKLPQTYQIVIPEHLITGRGEGLVLAATNDQPGRLKQQNERGFLLLSDVRAISGPPWVVPVESETLAVSAHEELVIVLSSEKQQWLSLCAWTGDGASRATAEVLSGLGDRAALGSFRLGENPDSLWLSWEWPHAKCIRQRVTIAPVTGTANVRLREVAYSPPRDQVTYAVYRAPRADAEKPPVVVILLDAFRADRWGARRGGRSITPALDALARKGVFFPKARCHVPYTRGSLPTILSGCYPPQEDGTRHHLDRRSLASILRDAGYVTVAISSNPFLRPGTDTARGFDLVVDVESWNRERAAEGPAYWSQHALEPLAEMLFTLGNRPFFLFLHLMQPHGPYNPPPPYDTLYVSSDPGRLAEFPAVGPQRLQALEGASTPNEIGYLRSMYDGNVSYADDVVGRILTVLERFGPARPPILIVLSDHGETLMEHGLAGHEDGQLYEESLQVPLLITGPGIPRGVARDAPARLADVAPTVLDLVGLPPPLGTDGTSLVPLFEARHAPPPEPVYTLSRPRVSDPFRVAVFHWPWKYIVTERGGDPAARAEELYDLSADAGETHNIAALHRDVCGRFGTLCAAWLGRELPEVAPSVESLSDEDRERLEALGYIGP